MLAELHPGTEWTNWVGNQSFTPAYAAAPRDEEEVAALVRRAAELGAGVRVAAARHSFTPIVQTDGLLLDVSALNGVVATDVPRRRATALAGTPIHDFYEPLWSAGLALKNQGDIDDQQIAGAVATATHGSGIRNRCFSGVVRGVRLVTATGEVREIGENEPDLLRAAQVSVGMLGVMTQLELEVTAQYRLSEQIDLWAWEEVLERWDELVHEHRHFGFFWLPTEESAALYNLSGHGDTMADKCYVKIYDEPAPDVPDSSVEGRRVERCYRIYPMVYSPNFHELEYFVPLERAWWRDSWRGSAGRAPRLSTEVWMYVSKRTAVALSTAAALAGSATMAVSAIGDQGNPGRGHGEHADRSLLDTSLAPSIPSDPTLLGAAAGGVPWVLRFGEASLRDSGRLDVSIRGLVIPTAPFTGTAGPVTTVDAWLLLRWQFHARRHDRRGPDLDQR